MIYEHRTYTARPFRLRQQLDLFAEHGLRSLSIVANEAIDRLHDQHERSRG